MSSTLPQKISNLVFVEITLWLIENRPPEEIRPKLDIFWRFEKKSVIIFEIRPDWQNPDIIRNSDFAKVTYVKSSNKWKIYWKRSDLKWHRYKPLPVVQDFEEFLNAVSIDAFSCFKG